MRVTEQRRIDEVVLVGERVHDDLSVLELPLGGTGQAKVLRRFKASSLEDFPNPPVEETWSARPVRDFAADADGHHLAYWEITRFDSNGGEYFARRLWVWDAATGQRRLAAVLADYADSGREGLLEVEHSGQVRTLPPAREAGWAYPTSCALSPDGTWLAYDTGQDLRFVRITTTADE